MKWNYFQGHAVCWFRQFMFRQEVSQPAISCGKCWSKTPCLRTRLGYPVIIVPPSSVRNYFTEHNQATTQQTTISSTKGALLTFTCHVQLYRIQHGTCKQIKLTAGPHTHITTEIIQGHSSRWLKHTIAVCTWIRNLLWLIKDNMILSTL